MAELNAGAVRVVITPPVGVELAGYDFGPSEGVLDDMEAQALVLDTERSGEGPLAIVTVDVLGLYRDLVERVRARSEHAWGIPASRVLISATHTHSGPATQYLRGWGKTDPTYLQSLEDHLVGLVGMARRLIAPARAGWGMGHVAGIGENRRHKGGAVDLSVPVVRIDRQDGTPLAVLHGYGCHPVALHSYRNVLSPDYPGYARQTVQAVLGKDVTVLFLVGTLGDVNPSKYVARETTPERARQLGALLGCETAKVALGLETNADVALGVASEIVDLPVEALPPVEEITQQRDEFVALTARLRDEGRPRWEVSTAEIKRDWADEALGVLASGVVQTGRQAELQVVRIGRAAIASMPLEVFTETGRLIRESSPAAVTFIASNSNGAMGYLPTADSWEMEKDYAGPRGLAPKVCGVYAFAKEAEPFVRQRCAELLNRLFQT